MLCMALVFVSVNVQGQGFLKKLGNAVDKATKTLDGSSKSSSKSSAKKTTVSTTKKTSATKIWDDDEGAKEPDGYKSNIYGGDMDNEPKGIAKFAEYKKTDNTKVITVDEINDIELGYPADNRILVSTRKNGTLCMDYKGNIVHKFEKSGFSLTSAALKSARFNSGRLIYKTSEKIGDRWCDVAIIYDENMKVVKKIQDVETFSSFKDGVSVMYYMVMSKEKHNLNTYTKCIYVDVNGNKIFPNLSQPYENNIHGHWLTKNDTRPLCDGLAAFSAPKDRDLVWGFRDAKGKVVVPAKYHQVRDFCNGLAAVATNESGSIKWGFIDKTGQEVIPPKFSIEPSRFDNTGLALVFNKEEKGMFIDKTGKIVSKEYEGTHISPFYNGKAILTVSDYDEENGWTNGDMLIDKDFNVIAHIGKGYRLQGGDVKECAMRYYPDLDNFTKGINLSPVLFYDNRIYVQLKKFGYGLLDEKGNVVIAGLAGPFVEGMAPVISDAGKGYVNEKGEWLIKFEESNF